MRIGMMVDVYKPHVSGITNYVSLSKKHLEMWGHEVFVFTFGDEDYRDEEINIIRSPGLPLLETGYFLSLRYSRAARFLLRTMDIVHIHHPFISGSLALPYCRARGIPAIFTNHTRYDLYARAYLSVLPDFIGETALEAYLPLFCRNCDLVIAPSRGMQEVLVRFGVTSTIDVVPNGVELSPFRSPTQPLGRDEFGIGDQDIVLIYTGRLGPEKNLPFLLRSFAGAAQAYNHLHLIIVGDGIERDNLEDRVVHMGLSSRVHFTGMVPYEHLPRYLAMADAFITASVTEVHPLSVIEALASGLPVLGIKSPGIDDSVIDGETGFLVPEEDLAAFTAKMIRLITEQDTRRTMSVAARKSANRFAIENTTQSMLKKYDQVIHHAGTRKRSLRTQLIRILDRWRS